MSTRRLLIGLPIVVLVFLLQSYFWVPTYEEQTRGNPQRLGQYVTASIGDAQLLNPILSADSASIAQRAMNLIEGFSVVGSLRTASRVTCQSTA